MSDFFGKVHKSQLAKLRKLPKGSILAFMSLSIYANKNGQCWPAQTTLASDSGLSVRGLQKALALLESAGMISIKRQGKKRPNLYTLKSDTHFCNSDTHFSDSDTHFSDSDTYSRVSTNRSIKKEKIICRNSNVWWTMSWYVYEKY